MRTTPAPSRSRAFTLLELLLAVAILSAVFGIVASMWGQAGGWNRDIAQHAEALRLQRVIAMMKDQWANRRTGVALGDSKARVLATGRQVTFPTASPILFPDWPLVVATYRIEEEREPGRTGLWRIMYEETRIASGEVDTEELTIDPARWEPGRDPRGRPVRDRTVLLDGMASAAFERFGREARFDSTVPEDKAAKKRDGAVAGTSSEGEASDTPPVDGSSVSTDTGKSGGASGAAASDAGLSDSTEDRQAKRDTWRPLDEEGYPGVMPAVRLVGEFDKEKFACVFVILVSR